MELMSRTNVRKYEFDGLGDKLRSHKLGLVCPGHNVSIDKESSVNNAKP